MENLFVYAGDEKIEKAHWVACEKLKQPFILITSKGPDFDEIFFDITNLTSTGTSQDISRNIKKFYETYISFFELRNPRDIEDQHDDYFFRFSTKHTHTEEIAQQLFHYLKNNIR